MTIDWKKKIFSEAFSDKEIPKKNRPETLKPVPVVKVQESPEQIDAFKKEVIKAVKDDLIKEIKDSKALDVTDLKNGHSIIYPNKKVQDLRWHGGGGTGGVTKIIAGTNITISPSNGLGDVTINADDQLDFYDAFIAPSGADYTTVADAINAGKKTLCVMGNTTETQQISLTSDTYIYIKYGCTLDLDSFNFTNNNNESITINGNGVLRWAYGSTKKVFVFNQDDRVNINGITLTNESTASNTYLGFSLQERVTNVFFNLPNAAAGGIQASRFGCFYSNIFFLGGGSACTLALNLTSANNGPITANNIQLGGDFKLSSASDTDSIVQLDYLAQLTNLTYIGDTNIRVGIRDISDLSNVIATGFGDIDIYAGSFSGGNIHLTNIDIDNGSIVISGSTVHLVNAQAKTLDASLASADQCSFTDCIVNDAVSVGGDKHKFSNTAFLGGATVVSGADDNGFSNCQFGNTGGGANTITINAGSNRTRIVGCMSDAAISDAGTGTVTAANTVY